MSQGLYYTLIVIGALVVWGSLVALALRGWRNRGRRQEDTVGAFPTPPADADALGATLVPTTTGLYVGSTIAPSWQNRVAVGDYGDRAVTEMTAYDAGILLERTGANPIWIPADSIVAVRTENGLAGKVMSRDGVLVIRWTLPSGLQIDSGLRGDDKKAYPQWTAAYADQTERAFAEQDEIDELEASAAVKPKKPTYVDGGWPAADGDEHAVTELLASLSGALSPFGETRFPIPSEDLPYVHSKTSVNS